MVFGLILSNQAVSNYMRKGYSVGEGIVYKICSVFPQINRTWLLTGEGEMLKKENDASMNLSTSSNYRGVNSRVGTSGR